MASRKTYLIVAAVLGVYAVSIGYYVSFYEGQQAILNSQTIYIEIAGPTSANGTAAFVPTAFTVAQGKNVTLIISNGDTVTHGLAIPRFNVNSGAIPPGLTLHLSFVASQTGTFVYNEPAGSCAAQGGVCDSKYSLLGNMTVVGPGIEAG